MLQLHAASYCKATYICCMDLMGTCLGDMQMYVK